LKNKQGFLKSDSQSKANILNDQFTSVFTKEDDGPIPNKGPSNFNNMPDINITENGVYILQKNLNVNKAAGSDQIPTKILQAASSELAPALSRLFQFSLDTGEIPQDRSTMQKRGYPTGCKLPSCVINSNCMQVIRTYST
jgi:hypothetical protein